MGEVLGLRGAGGTDFGVRGSVVAAPILGSPPDASLGQVNLSFHEPGNQPGAGGGGVSYAFDCPALLASEELLDDRLVDVPMLDENGHPMLDEDEVPIFTQRPATDFWRAECDGGLENIFEMGPAELQLLSWRENLGWRERAGFFSGDTIQVDFP